MFSYGTLNMYSTNAKELEPGTYDIAFGVTQGGVSATCTTQVILTDPCQTATFTRNFPDAFPNKSYTLGDPEMEIMTWTWPQVVTQSIPDHIQCDLKLLIRVTKDGGSTYSFLDDDTDVWNQDYESGATWVKKRATTVSDTSQIGEYVFGYRVRIPSG